MNVFLAEKGLTSTSANHIANLANEVAEELRQKLSSINFYEVHTKLLSSNTDNITQKGVLLSELQSYKEYIYKIGSLNSLIAWLREGIKAKEKLQKKFRMMSFEEYLIMNNLELKYPQREEVLTEEEYLETLPIKERNLYLSLEAKASAIGRYIHQEGNIKLAKDALANAIAHPLEVRELASQIVVTEKVPTISSEEVDKVYFELQDKFRTYQAQLNSMKSACQQAINDSEKESNDKYFKDMELYQSLREKYAAEFKEYLREQRKAVSDLRIAIPDTFKLLIEELKKLSK
jgi:hypothetical protein